MEMTNKTHIVDALKQVFPDEQVQLRSGNPTVWAKNELSNQHVTGMIDVALREKLGLSIKRSGAAVRITFK